MKRAGLTQTGHRKSRVKDMNVRPSSTGGRNRASTRQHRPSSTARSSSIDMAERGLGVSNVLVIDVGGTSVKVLATGQSESRSFRSGPRLTPRLMVSKVKKLAADWAYDAVSIGYPGPVLGGRPSAEPVNLGRGWIGFDFEQALGVRVRVINDAAMQALGSYRGGKMLFLGLGTGLGSAVIVEGLVKPMEVGHMPYKDGTYEHYVGRAGLEREGKRKWRRHVADVIERLVAALRPDDTVIGGGNVKKLDALPARCRAGKNANAFLGGFRLWAGAAVATAGPLSAHARPDEDGEELPCAGISRHVRGRCCA